MLKLSTSALALVMTTTGAAAQVELPAIPSNFDKNLWLHTAGIPPSMAPDVVGAFRFQCIPSHLGYNDPIINPGADGGSAHLHQFTGNDKTDAFSTYESLRSSGNGTCNGGPLNRSGYWIPAMLDGKGHVVLPVLFTIYYKGKPHGGSRELPRGLRYIFGFSMAQPDLPIKTQFQCVTSEIGADGVKRRVSKGVSLARSIKDAIVNGCPASVYTGTPGWDPYQPDTQLMVALGGPNCWDGVNLDKPDHRSHMSHKIADASNNWVSGCPPTHPVELPGFLMSVAYQVMPGDDLTLWHFSSDRVTHADGTTHNFEPGTTFHSDWFGAWDDDIKARWQKGCIDGFLSGVEGNLCDGFGLNRAAGQRFSWPIGEQRLVPIPVRPGQPGPGDPPPGPEEPPPVIPPDPPDLPPPEPLPPVPPTVAFTEPPAGHTFGGNARVDVATSASDATGITSTVISLDGRVIHRCGITPTCTTSFRGRDVSSGTHTLSAVATNRDDTAVTKSISVQKR